MSSNFVGHTNCKVLRYYRKNCSRSDERWKQNTLLKLVWEINLYHVMTCYFFLQYTYASRSQGWKLYEYSSWGGFLDSRELYLEVTGYIQTFTLTDFVRLCCRHRLELMRVIYNDDLSPDTPEAKQDFFHCLSGCGNQNYFNFVNLMPSRLVSRLVTSLL